MTDVDLLVGMIIGLLVVGVFFVLLPELVGESIRLETLDEICVRIYSDETATYHEKIGRKSFTCLVNNTVIGILPRREK